MDQIVLERSDGWSIGLADRAAVAAKRQASRLSFAVLLLFYRAHGRFPRRASEIEAEAIATVARQIDVPADPFDAMDMGDRTLKRQRAEIRSLLGFREATVADGEVLTEWLSDHAVADSRDIAELTSALEQRCRDIKIEPPGADRIERIVRAALHAHDEQFCSDTHDRLSAATRARLDALLSPATTAPTAAANEEPDSHIPAVLMSLRSDPGGPSVNSLQNWLSWTWFASSGCPPIFSLKHGRTRSSATGNASQSKPHTSCAGIRNHCG